MTSYNFGQMLQNQNYENCLRTEAGYCSIEWQESSIASPDPFGILGGAAGTNNVAGAGGSANTLCNTAFVSIPDLSMNGVAPLSIPLALQGFQDNMCGTNFGIEGQTTPSKLTCKTSQFGVISLSPDLSLQPPGCR